MWGQQPDLVRCWRCLWRHQWVPQYTPRNVVRTRSFACIDPAEGSPHAVRGQRHHLVAGRRWSLLCSGAVLCFASKEGIQLVQQGDGAVTGLWWGLVVRNGLYCLPQAQSVSAVAETMGYPPGVLSLASLMPRDRLALAVFRPSSSPALKAAFRAFRSLWTSPVSHGFWLARTVIFFVTVTSSMHLVM